MDHYQYLGNCPPTPPLTQQKSIDNKLKLMLGQGRGTWAVAQIPILIHCCYHYYQYCYFFLFSYKSVINGQLRFARFRQFCGFPLLFSFFFTYFFHHSFFQFSLSPRYISLFAVFFCRLDYTVTIQCRVLNLPVSKNGILLNLPLIQFFSV